jgi:hypothetical protein
MIYYIPFGNENTASSRLRVFKPGQHIQDAFVGVPEKYQKGDVLIIQKTPQREEMKKAQAEGAKVIYDIDDYYWDKNDWQSNPQEFRSMIKNADLITVDTEEKKKMLGFVGKKSRLAVVIPDCLDWDGEFRTEQPKNGIIGWTGYGNSGVYLDKVRKDLPREYTLRLITSADWPKYVKAEGEEVQSRPWSLDMVDHYLRECEFTIYPLPDEDFTKCKGMHKLLKSWANKIPCYTSPMPDYVKAMEEAGVGTKYLVEDWSKLKNIGFDEKCYEYAMRYSSDKVAQLWVDCIKSL